MSCEATKSIQERILTLFFPMFLFDPPEIIRKPKVLNLHGYLLDFSKLLPWKDVKLKQKQRTFGI